MSLYDIIIHIIVYVAWYHSIIIPQYHMLYHIHIWYDNVYDIIYIQYHIQYHIVWYHIWYQLWYHIYYHANGMISYLLMSSKEFSNFTWNCGIHPTKMIYFAGLKTNKMSFISAGIQTLLYTLSGSVGYNLIIDPLCDTRLKG